MIMKQSIKKDNRSNNISELEYTLINANNTENNILLPYIHKNKPLAYNIIINYNINSSNITEFIYQNITTLKNSSFDQLIDINTLRSEIL